MDNFLYPIPLKAPELGRYACFGLIPLPHTESMRSETPRQLSQRGVRLCVNWVNAEWDSVSTESTRSETQRQLSEHRRHQHLRRFHHSALAQLTWSLNLHWLSLHVVLLGIDSVDREWDSVSTESLLSVKKLNKSANSSTKSKTLKSLIIWPIYVWTLQKTWTKKSHAIVPLTGQETKSTILMSYSPHNTLNRFMCI